MATATTFSLAVSVDGGNKSITLTGSDVTTEALVFPDGSTQNTLGSGAAVIRDVLVGATGSTSKVQVYVNGIYIGYDIFKASNLPTAVGRQVQATPIGIKAGATVKFIQIT